MATGQYNIVIAQQNSGNRNKKKIEGKEKPVAINFLLFKWLLFHSSLFSFEITRRIYMGERENESEQTVILIHRRPTSGSNKYFSLYIACYGELVEIFLEYPS
jgi:hypothetical protein